MTKTNSIATAAAPSTTLTLGDPSPRPWRRYFARMIDLFVGSFIALYGLTLLLPDVAALLTRADNSLAWSLAMIALTIPLEALALSVFGATPGKALLGLRVIRGDGALLPFDAAVGRSARMWVSGLGIGIPLVCLFTMARAKAHLETKLTATWDRQAASTVRYVRQSAA